MKRWAASAAIVAGMVFTAHAHAAYNIYVYQSGTDVVASGSGSLALGGLTPTAPAMLSARVLPSSALILIGAAPPYTGFIGATGPASFGPGAFNMMATSSSGDAVAVQGLGGFVVVPVGYVSGSPLSSSSTWAGSTIAGLGLTPGTYTYTWASDSFTVNIGMAPPGAMVTPVPLSPLALLGLIGLLGCVGAISLRRLKS